MTHHARNIAFLPNIAEACDRIAARTKAKNKDDELLAAAVSVLHDWRDYPAAVVRGAIVTAEKSDDGYAVQVARQVRDQINAREQIARNRPRALMPWMDAARRDKRHGRTLAALALGYVAALGLIVALRWGGVM